MSKNEVADSADPWIEPLDFTAFAVKTTGLVVAETKLTIDEYTLHAAFYKASTSRLLLLVALSKHEVALFRKSEGSFAGVTMAFQQPGMRRPLRIFARCTITRIAEMTQREGISMLETEIKPIPDDYRRILEEYRTLLSCLKDDYERYANQSVRMAPQFAKLLGFNNHAVLRAYGNRFELAVVSIASNHLEFLLQSAPPDIAPGNENSIKLSFQAHQFFVHGKSTKVDQVSPGVVHVEMDLDFSPELMDIFATYRQQAHMLAVSGDTASSAGAAAPTAAESLV
jgi:hypothetical protein